MFMIIKLKFQNGLKIIFNKSIIVEKEWEKEWEKEEIIKISITNSTNYYLK